MRLFKLLLKNIVYCGIIFFLSIKLGFGQQKTDPATCKKYEGKYISYYDEIYKVTKCVRVLIEDHSTLFSFQAKGGKILDVDAQVIKNLPEEVVLTTAKTTKTCRELEGKYITYTLNEIFLMEKCKKRLFLDWESYKSHSRKKSVADKKIVQLTWEEFTPLVLGAPIFSDTDEYFKNELATENLDIIPITKACHGLEGKIVAYYHELYRIESCKKRLFVDGHLHTKHSKDSILELDSQRWMSLPYGRPIETIKDKKDIEFEKSQ